jgi:hypothetical protein
VAERSEVRWGTAAELSKKESHPALPEDGEGRNVSRPFGELERWNQNVPTQIILLPVFLQVALTFVLLCMTRSGGNDIRFKDEPNDPAGSAAVASAYNSQFQLPELFYVVVVLAYLLRKADYLFVLLSFGFVAARIVHAYVMVTSNQARLRYGAFAAGMMILALMWASFAVRVLFGV